MANPLQGGEHLRLEATMARPIWTGALTFGLVTVPVGLYSATESHTVQFRQIQRGTSDRVRIRRVNERTGMEVQFSDIVKGYDLGEQQYVVIEPGELDDIAPGRSKVITVTGFVDITEVDPIYYENSYYLAPRGEEYAGVYALLLEAMQDSGKVGIASFVMRGKEYLTAIRPADGILQLHTLHYADEVRDPRTELPVLPDASHIDPQQLAAARQLIDVLVTTWDPEQYRDSFEDRVHELIDAKREGAEIVSAESAPESSNVLDLMALLQRSIDERSGVPAQTAAPAGGERENVQPIKPTGPSREELGELTKAELYERATEAGVSGRSKMTREELVDALAGGGKKRRGRSAA